MAKVEYMQTQTYSSSVAHKVEPNDHERKVAEFLFQKCPMTFNICLSDGTLMKRTHQPKFTLIINDRHVFKELLFSPNDLTLGKAYIDKRIDVEGDVLEVMRLGDDPDVFKFSFREKLALALSIVLFL